MPQTNHAQVIAAILSANLDAQVKHALVTSSLSSNANHTPSASLKTDVMPFTPLSGIPSLQAIAGSFLLFF